MSEAAATSCPKCGAAIPPEAPQGLCPKCLLQQASFPTETGPTTRHTRPAPPDRDELARAFPHLQILELIGQGGMGFVYKARQPKLDRLVALKILAQPLAEQTHFAERFTREGRTLAKLNHPNIVTIHDFGQAGPFFYLLMEYVDGVNLRQAMRAGAVNSSQALAIVPRICEALQYAHNEGVLHRDIKPDNILLDTRGRVKIADFGIAKLMAEAVAENPLTGSGASLGTPHYMAPEQIEKPNAVDHRADIYSLGVVFYEMLTGELPLGRFAAPSEKSAIDPRLDEVVFQTLEKQPERRPQSADEVRTKVETISSNPRAESKPTAQPLPFKMPALLKGALTVALVVILGLGVGLGAFIGLYALLRHPNPRPTDAPANVASPDREPQSQSPITTQPAIAQPHSTPTNTLAGASAPSRLIEIGNIYITNSYWVGVQVKTEPGSGEHFSPVIRYGDSPWGKTEALSTREIWVRDEGKTSYDSQYLWPLPESFRSDFDLAAAVMRARAKVLGPIRIVAAENVDSIFTISNRLGQSIACGIRLEQLPPATRPALLLKAGGAYDKFNLTQYHGWASPDLPSCCRLEAIATIDGQEMPTITSLQNGYYNFSWYIPHPMSHETKPGWKPSELYVKSFEKVEVPADGQFVFQSFTNSGGKVAKFLLQLVPKEGNLGASNSASAAKKTFEFTSVTNSDHYIVLQSETPIPVGKQLVALIEDSTGKVTRALSGLAVRSLPSDTFTTSRLMWKAPDGSPTNWIEATLQKIRETILAKPIQLSEGQSTNLFTLRSTPGLVEQFATVRYEHVQPSPSQTSAKIRVRSTYPMNSGLILNFDADVPPGYRLEAQPDSNDNGSEARLDCSNIGGHNYYNAVWTYQNMRGQNLADIRAALTNQTARLTHETFVIAAGQSSPIVTFQTSSGDQFSAILKLNTPHEP